jgi:transposase
MNKLSTDERVRVVSALVEGCSIRSTVRMTGVAKNTVSKLLVELGTACEAFHDQHVRGLKTKRVQLDEIWSFCYCKAQNMTEKNYSPERGDVWTWAALDADSKLVCNWLVGNRGGACAQAFVADLAERLNDRVQITSDGWDAYRSAI